MERSFLGASLRSALVVPMLALGTAVFALPAAAQSTDTSHAQITRASVRAELDELVAAGYNPRDWYHYPDNLQAAQRIVEQRHAALAQSGAPMKAMADDSSHGSPPAAQGSESMGGVMAGKSEAGGPMHTGMSTQRSSAADCTTGPQCSIYYGH